jgi:hypothetical protein
LTYPEMRVGPVREGAVGVTISGTEYVMPVSEAARLHGMIGVALWPPPASMATDKESTQADRPPHRALSRDAT